MSAEIEDLARRVAALEERLAPAARHEGAKVAAIEHTVKAMWLTQGEHSTILDEHTVRLIAIEDKLDALGAQLALILAWIQAQP